LSSALALQYKVYVLSDSTTAIKKQKIKKSMQTKDKFSKTCTR